MYNADFLLDEDLLLLEDLFSDDTSGTDLESISSGSDLGIPRNISLPATSMKSFSSFPLEFTHAFNTGNLAYMSSIINNVSSSDCMFRFRVPGGITHHMGSHDMVGMHEILLGKQPDAIAAVLKAKSQVFSGYRVIRCKWILKGTMLGKHTSDNCEPDSLVNIKHKKSYFISDYLDDKKYSIEDKKLLRELETDIFNRGKFLTVISKMVISLLIDRHSNKVQMFDERLSILSFREADDIGD